MKNIINTLISIAVIILLFNSCASVSSVAKTITIESGEIPPGMKEDSFVLIGILKEKRVYDKYVKKEFANYTGNYLLISQKEMFDKYNDLDKYRYYMDYDLEPSFNGSAIVCRYHIYDRKESKIYRRKYTSSFYAWEIRAYLIAIEAVRKK